MCFPIQYAVTWSERIVNYPPPLNPVRRAGLTFGTTAAMYNAANEVSVQAFSVGLLCFPD